MKKPLLLCALFGAAFTMNSQTVLFEDSFETYTTFAIDNVGEWTLTDVDASFLYGFQGADFENMGDPFAFIVFDSNATTPPLEVGEGSDWTARTGTKAMAAFAAILPDPDEPVDGVNGPNNDWLISPQIQLGTNGNMLKFWAKNATVQYGLEQFRVLVSTTGTDTADFTPITTGLISPAGTTWNEFTYDLQAYANQPVYIAINCVSNDKFGFLVDDFSVTSTDVAGVNDQLASQLSVFPNPASNVMNVTNNKNILVNGIQIVDLNGRTVKTIAYAGVTDAQINISDLASGMYMMTVSSDKGTMTKKIVKN